MKIAIIDYKCGNVRSVQFAVERLGYTAFLTDDPVKIRAADKVIFPGVGHAAYAMKVLKERQLDRLIRSLSQPVLGICLGMQLLCTHTEEGNTEGLGVFQIAVRNFDLSPPFKVPQMGWNQLYNCSGSLFENTAAAYVYFVHSFYAELSKYTGATCTYAHPFSAALHKDNFYATQFHPEKSADAGGQILANFLTI